MTYRILDLFSGPGGAAIGYAQAGFEVVGVDLFPQPNYPFAWIQADALALDPRFLRFFDAIHASPPCQAHTAMKTMHNAKAHADLIAPTRRLLQATGLPWVMENVVGAPLVDAVTLCGTMFGLGAGGYDLQRHRLFETSFPVGQPECRHTRGRPVLGVYGGHVRNRKRWNGSADRGVADPSYADGCEAMGLHGLTLGELSQAIPPAFTRHIGAALSAHLDAMRAESLPLDMAA